MARYRINLRFLLILGVGLGVLATGTHLLHKRQRGSQAAVLMEQADAAEARGDQAKAADYLRRYLSTVPTDHKARARFGLILSHTARSPQGLFQSYLVMDEALRNLPDRDDVRRRAAEVALALGTDLLPDAKRHLDELVRSHPEDGQLDALYADAHLIEARYENARERLVEAIRKKPDLYSAHLRLALVLRQRLNRPDEADTVIKELAAAHPKSFQAQLAAAGYWGQSGNLDSQAEAVARAQALAPDDIEVLLAVADLAQERARTAVGRGDGDGAKAALAEARAALGTGIERYAADAVKTPSDDAGKLRRALVGELFRQLVTVEVRAGQLAEAEKVARRGVEVLPDMTDLQLAVADVLIRRGSFDEARNVLDRVQGDGPPSAVVKYHRGRVLVGKNDWLKAIETLEDLLRDDGLSREMIASASLLLGGCYEQIGELDRRYAVYTKAAAAVDLRDPNWIEAHSRLAAVLVEMGQTADAIEVYEKLVARGVPGANVPLGRLFLADTLRRPADRRDWTRVERVVGAAPDGIEAALLRAELAAARGKHDDALQTLTAAIAKHPDAVRPRLALAMLEHRAGHGDRAKEVLETVRAKFGDTADVRLAEARMLTGPDVAAGLARIAEGTEQLPPPEVRRLLHGLVELADRGGAGDLASRLRERLAQVSPDDLGVHQARLDDAIRRNDDAAAQAALARVRTIDGENGTTAKTARAVYLVWRAQTGDRSGLAEAEDLLNAVEKQRPWWSRVAFAKGLVADLKGNQAAAAARYREAIDAGDRRPEVVRRLFELYYARQQYRDFEELLQKLPEAAGVAGGELLVAELSARSGNLTRAVESASRGVPDDSTDPKKLLWLAQIRRLANAPAAEIEKPIRRAIEVAGDQPDPWVALVQFLVAADRKPEAEREAASAEKRIGGPGRSLALAQCQESLGNSAAARELFAAALRERPNDVATLRAGVSFFLRTNEPERARELCERVLGLQDLPTEDKQFAVRTLSVILTASQDYQTSRRGLEAIGVLERGLPARLSGSESIEQLRARAVALAVQPDPNLRREAIAAMEAVELRQKLTADDQFFLARVYVSVGDWGKARLKLAPLAQSGADNLYYVAYYGNGVLQFDGDVKEARRSLDLLEPKQPDAPRTIALKARILEAEEKPGEAADVVLEFARRQPDRLEFAAGLLERIGLGDRAEELHRKLAADPKKPVAKLGLAAYLGRQGRTADALTALRSLLADKVPAPATAAVAVEVLYNAPRVEPTQVREVEEMIRAVGTGAKGFDPRGLTAVVRMVEGRPREAIALYREVVAGGTADAMTMNNLGYLLATEEKQYEEGLEWVRKAQKAAGPLPTLRDTEAVILLRMGKPEEAVGILTEITKESENPVAHFHLAQAHLALNNRAAAASALERAKRWKIRPIDLPPAERGNLEHGLAALK